MRGKQFQLPKGRKGFLVFCGGFNEREKRHRHGLESPVSHRLRCNPWSSALAFLTIQFPLWQPQAVDIIIPQINSTKAAGEILIPNPCESIHSSQPSPSNKSQQVGKTASAEAKTSRREVSAWVCWLEHNLRSAVIWVSGFRSTRLHSLLSTNFKSRYLKEFARPKSCVFCFFNSFLWHFSHEFRNSKLNF